MRDSNSHHHHHRRLCTAVFNAKKKFSNVREYEKGDEGWDGKK